MGSEQPLTVVQGSFREYTATQVRLSRVRAHGDVSLSSPGNFVLVMAGPFSGFFFSFAIEMIM